MSTPPESAARSSLPTENPTGVASRLVRLTVTHSPATTCITSGTGCFRPRLMLCTSPSGTKAVRPPLRVWDLSMALRLKVLVGADDGQGLASGSGGGGE